jgi:hypothetical protein
MEAQRLNLQHKHLWICISSQGLDLIWIIPLNFTHGPQLLCFVGHDADEPDNDPHHLHYTSSQRDRHGETRGSYKRPHGESIHHHPHHCQSMKGHSHHGEHHHGDSIHGNHNRDRPGSTRHTGHRHFESKRLANKGDVMSDKPVPDDYLANRPPQQLKDVACAAVCPHCKYKVWTKISYENGCLVWTLVILLTLIA